MTKQELKVKLTEIRGVLASLEIDEEWEDISQNIDDAIDSLDSARSDCDDE